MDPVFFESPAAFRAWLALHHATERELVVGFYRKNSGPRSVTYSEALDEALCFGWIDGIRHTIDSVSFCNRFTPRKRTSNWSRINMARVEALIVEGRMQPAGMKAFEERDRAREGVYSFENAERTSDVAQLLLFQANAAAWEFFQRQPPGYRRLATWWVVSAKREATREARLQRLIDDSAGGRRLAPYG